MPKKISLGILFAVLLSAVLVGPRVARAQVGGSWVKLYEGSNITNLFVEDESHLWAVGENAVILQSKDGGRSWEKRYDGGMGWLNAIFMRDSRNGWAVGSGAMIVTTSDGGKNWVRQPGTGATDYNCIHFPDANHGFIGAGAGTILITEDGGKTWKAQQFKFPSADPNAPPSPNVMRSLGTSDVSHAIVLKDDDKVMITENGGKNWKVSGFPEGFSLSQLYVQGSTAWLGGGRKLSSGTVLASLWHSTDAGKTWRPLNFAKLLTHNIESVWFADEQNGLISVDGKIYRTTDGGLNWTVFYQGDEKVRRIFPRDPDHIWAIIGGSIYRYAAPASTSASPPQ